MSDRLYKMATGGGYTPVVFQGSSINLPTPNLDILRQGWEAREARQDKAIQQQTAIDVALGKIQEQLNPNELEWFDDYKDNINNQIQTQINEGNYTTAIRTATSLAGKVAKDKDVLGRIKQQEYFKTAQDKVVNDKTLSDDTKEWWVTNHQYNYNPTLGAQEVTDLPTGPTDYIALAAKAIQLAAPEQGSQGTVDITNQTHSSYSWSRLSADKIKEVFNSVLASTPGARQSIMQDKAVDKYTLAKLAKELQDTNLSESERKEKQERLNILSNRLKNDNGTWLSDDEYMAKRIEPTLYNAAYNIEQNDITQRYNRKNDTNSLNTSDIINEIIGTEEGVVEGGGQVGVVDNSGKTSYQKTTSAAQAGINALIEAIQTNNLNNPF